MNKQSWAATAVAGAALAMSACSTTGATNAGSDAAADAGSARAMLVTASGADAGTAMVTVAGKKLRLNAEVKGMTPGPHGVHLHMVGRCDAPSFESAGGHWNPGRAQHGLDNPRGAHRGDLPNIDVGADGTGSLVATIDAAMIDGEGGLLDNDGAAFIVHAGRDDMVSDPAGNSGSRVACGVFNRTR